MTTEIAVLNKLGVALATDSAVTITSGGRTKIFNSADKLFELSSRFPVAVMINGNMDCAGVPWEIVVKDFRHSLGDINRASIEEWFSDFLDFVQVYKGLDRGLSFELVQHAFDEEILSIRSHVSVKMQDFMFRGTRPRGVDQEKMIGWTIEVIAERQAEVDQLGRATSLEILDYEDVLKEYGPLIAARSAQWFSPVKLNKECSDNLHKLLIDMLMSSDVTDVTSGLVVAGFGSESLFPELSAAQVGGFVLDRLKVSTREPTTLAEAEDAGRVISFAQTDVIERLLGGADPQFVDKSAEFIEIAVRDAASSIEEVCRPARIKRADLEKRQFAINAVVEALVAEYKGNTADKLRRKFNQEFDRMVAMMPKQELIELDEALVSITAVERKASSDDGTVGGPIDVALITKHDGFVWIKRKHYFKAYLNPNHFWRKYGSGGPAGGEHED